jgi:hypothetical protein
VPPEIDPVKVTLPPGQMAVEPDADQETTGGVQPTGIVTEPWFPQPLPFVTVTLSVTELPVPDVAEIDCVPLPELIVPPEMSHA